MKWEDRNDLRHAIERLAWGRRSGREEVFQNLVESVRACVSSDELADRVLVDVLQVVYRALLQASHREKIAAGTKMYRRARRALDQRIGSLSSHWLVRPLPVDLIGIRELHEAYCPHGQRRACEETWSQVSRYQSRGGTPRALAEAKKALLAKGVDPEHASPNDFCCPDLRGPDERVQLPPAPTSKGRPRDWARDNLIKALVGLEDDGGLLTTAGLSVHMSLALARDVLLACFGYRFSLASLKRHCTRLRSRARGASGA